MTGADVTPLADQQVFRDVIGRFTSGVTVITTAVDGARFGTTASAFSSLSMEPPMVLVCLNKTSDTQAAVLKAGAFAVNILSEGQQDLAYRFTRKGDKFGDLAHDLGRHGVPVLQGTLAHLECEVGETVTGGTHTVYLAHVAVAAGHDGTPLTYYRGRFGRLESVREEEAYQAVRGYVLARRCPLDRPLEPAEPRGAPRREPRLPPPLRRAGPQPAARRHRRAAGHLGAVARGHRRARLAAHVRHHPPLRVDPGLPRGRHRPGPATDHRAHPAGPGARPRRDRQGRRGPLIGRSVK